MAACEYREVLLQTIHEGGPAQKHSSSQSTPHTPVTISIRKEDKQLQLVFTNGDKSGDKSTFKILLHKDTECCRVGKLSYVITMPDSKSIMLQFPNERDQQSFDRAVRNIKDGKESMFEIRTEEASAVQYFQFYGYLAQQQNMMQDYIRTSTYQKAMHANMVDFKDKVVLDVGAGSGILSFFAIQAGAKKVYAIEASSMAVHAKTLVKGNNMSEKVIVVPGKAEEVDLPENVDTIVSEPMGYMLFNERMLESYLHCKKWLKPNGRMFPSRGDLHIAPFSDEALYMEQFNKANFWYQTQFHGVDLSHLRQAAILEYFRQPIVDTFDIRICLAKTQCHTTNFRTADETDLHNINIPLSFKVTTAGILHGLAFWFDVAFIGTTQTVWLSTCPTEPLTHWYQVRCLLPNPFFVKDGDVVTGHVILQANTRQSYDVDIELGIEGTTTISHNCLDLKNPFFRYTGQQVAVPPGNNTTSPSENYWTTIDEAGGQAQLQQIQVVNGMQMNGVGDLGTQVMDYSNIANTINPGSIPSVGQINDGVNAMAAGVVAAATGIGGQVPVAVAQQTVAIPAGSSHSPNRYVSVHPQQQHHFAPASINNCSVGGGVAPVQFQQQSYTNVNNPLLIGDYAAQGNVVIANP